MKKIYTLTALLLLATLTSRGTSWNEPWADSIISRADYFVLATIKSVGDDKMTIEITKTLGGEALKNTIEIEEYYLLDLCSYSVPITFKEFIDKDQTAYFFLKKNEKGQYCIATPSTGYNFLIDGNVYANYRHSYHQALVPQDIYEKTTTAIFNHYHGLSYDEASIRSFVDENLSKKPAGFGEDEINTFFLQHVALECVHHLKLDGFYDKILPFLWDTLNFHNSVSAARALVAYNTDDCIRELLRVIEYPNFDPFIQVVCIWTLEEFHPTALKEDLKKVCEGLSETEGEWGGNIMDPRICTHMASPKNALTKLIAKL